MNFVTGCYNKYITCFNMNPVLFIVISPIYKGKSDAEQLVSHHPEGE